MKVLALTWGFCPTCRAEPIRPLPEGWSYTVQRRPTRIDRVTPHTENCPKGFKKVEIPDVDD